jgi:serine O-acetyltransferase
MPDRDYQADLKRLPRRPLLKEQSAWAIALYRFGRRNDRRKRGALRWIGDGGTGSPTA